MKIKIGDDLAVLRSQNDNYGISGLPTFAVAKNRGHWYSVVEYGKNSTVRDEYYICVEDIQSGTVTEVERDYDKICDDAASRANICEILRNNGY